MTTDAQAPTAAHRSDLRPDMESAEERIDSIPRFVCAVNLRTELEARTIDEATTRAAAGRPIGF
jgi:hypothetical protein